VNAVTASGAPDYVARFEEMVTHIGQQALVAWAMAFVDQQAAAQYFASSVGQEVGRRVGAGFTDGFKRGQQATEDRKLNAARQTQLGASTSSTPRVPTQSPPQASTGEQFMPFSEEELEAQLIAENQDRLDRLAGELTLQPLDIRRELKPGETLWVLAKEDLGPGATNAQIQQRAQQYMEVNGVSDPRALQIGQELKVPSGSETISTTTMQAYAESDGSLRQYQAAAAEAAGFKASFNLDSSILSLTPVDGVTGSDSFNIYAGAGMGLSMFAFDPALVPDNRVLFGQRRMSSNFGPAEINGRPTGRPDFLAGRDYREVAADLKANRLAANQLPIEVFERQGRLVSINTRSLAALSEAGMFPTNITRVEPTADVLARLGEDPILERLPNSRVPVTRGGEVIAVVELPPAPTPKLVTGLRVAGVGLTIVGVAADSYSLGTEINQSMQTGQWSNTAREATRIGGGWTGAWAGASTGGSAGAGVGATVGAFFFGAGAVPGAAIGGFIGSVGGGIAGYWGGSNAATTVYDTVTTSRR
jgi:LysM repeat protein